MQSVKPRVPRPLRTAAVLLVVASLVTPAAFAASLTPSRPGLMRQVHAARAHGYTYLQNEQQVRDFVRKGYLVRLPGDRNYQLKPGLPFPYARPEVKLFVERLGEQYRDACGEQLVVTSLTRPKNRQPRNSSPLSVHPTGMAMDLRVSGRRSCRAWLERALVNLERTGVLEAARERRPPHYHVVLFPTQYVSYLENRKGVEVASEDTGAGSAVLASYQVRRGDSLWTIARRYGTTVSSIQRANGIRSSRIKPGQVLQIPTD